MKRNELVIIEKYNKFYNYVYNPTINTNRKHKVLRDEFLRELITQYKLILFAVKSTSKSRIYDADVGLSNIRFLMRNLMHMQQDRRTFSLKQITIAETLLSEVGKILNSMLNKNK